MFIYSLLRFVAVDFCGMKPAWSGCIIEDIPIDPDRQDLGKDLNITLEQGYGPVGARVNRILSRLKQ